VTYRHPAMLAKIATTVDIISNGRLEFGLGAAWHEFEHRAYGIPFYNMGERQDRLEEALEVIKLLWTTSAPVTFRGKYYQLEDAPFLPPPVQKPHPPIMVGGSGPKRTLRTAARYADAVNLWGPLEMVQQSLKTLHAHCSDIGRNPAEIRITVFLPMAGTTADNKAIVRRFLDAGFDDFIATPLAKPDFDMLRRFAEEVVPAFQ